MTGLLKITGSLLVVSVLFSFCNDGEIVDEESRIDGRYYALQQKYDSLIVKYQALSDSLPVELHTSYRQLQRMSEQMETSYQRLLDEMLGGDVPAKNKKTGGITVHMRGHITGEWYLQMQKMHNSIAKMHLELGQEPMAERHKILAEGYEDIVQKGTIDLSLDKYSILDKGASDVNSCSSCHSNTKWLSTGS